jgi:hypothetical protein
MRNRLALGALLALTAVLAAPAAADATITVGSNLGRNPNLGLACNPAPCALTVAPASIPANAIEPAGLTSPVNGRVVTWRIRVGGSSGQVAFRVLRRSPGGYATGAGTSTGVTPPAGQTTPYPADLPIAIGDTIGLDIGPAPGSAAFVSGTTATVDRWSPAIPDGGAPQQVTGTSAYELTINADVEPTATLSTVTRAPRKGGKLQVSMQVPNAGILRAGDAQDASLSAAAAAKKPLLLKQVSAQIAAAGPLTILLKPTKAARSLLKKKGKLKARIKLTFTPTGGSSSTTIVKAKLKR